MAIEDATTRAMLDHAWRYFALHAAQRISIFNFFLVLSGFVAAGLAACLQRGAPFHILGVGLGLLLTLVSFTFWKLDQRTSFLIKHAEEAIADLEQSFPIASSRVVSSERDRTRAAVSSKFIVNRPWTYGTAFRLVFWIMAMVGLAGAALSFCRFLGFLS